MTAKNTAVVVVHGVADQKPGETADAVVDLLIASGPSDVRYAVGGRQAQGFAVEPMTPRDAPPRRADASPRREDRSAIKSFVQSTRSDFQRRDWHAPQTATAAWAAAKAPDELRSGDLGIAKTNYLLTKHRDNGAVREFYATNRIDVARSDRSGSTSTFAVYEMYWADLSRLSGALPRIVTELFTFVFRLSKLGRDTVDDARGALAASLAGAPGAKPSQLPFSWKAASGLQIALDWLFVNGLALLFAQLLLLAIAAVALGAAAGGSEAVVLRTVAAVVAVLSLLVAAYRRSDADKRVAMLSLAVAAIASAAVAWQSLSAWFAVFVLFALITCLYEIGLRIGDERFPFVLIVGRSLWSLTVALVVASAVHELLVAAPPGASGSVVAWRHGTLFGVEAVLFAIKWSWVAAAALLLAWLASGFAASWRRSYEYKASIATGRLGLAMSIAFFLTLAMAIWAVLTPVLDASAKTLAYRSCLFSATAPVSPRSTVSAASAASGTPVLAMSPLNRCLVATAAAAQTPSGAFTANDTSARNFLDARYESSTEAFSLVVVVLLALLAYLASVLMPSILAELKLLVERRGARASRARESHGTTRQRPDAKLKEKIAENARRLGRWLTAGYRRLDGAVALDVLVGVLLSVAIALLFVDPRGSLAVGNGLGVSSLNEEGIAKLSHSLLRPLVFTAAGIGGALTLLGGFLSRTLPPLRAPLDVALDVDNYLREFPRTSIPRARIFSRYAALLRHIVAQGHDRIVVVSHSQGTVISTELLRFLCSDGRHAPTKGDSPRLDPAGPALPEIRLLTLGCPLRQLYGARFPSLYRWAIARRGVVTGPTADDVGVSRWFNAFCSGDYVGRWLWSDSADDGDPIGHPMIDTVQSSAFGRSDAYASFDPMPPHVEPFARTREIELCLGVGAHTHYFEIDQTSVAWLIDQLLTVETAEPTPATGANG